jgi:energy-coupling factor transporter ATP-binding protein EcfA2
VFTIEYDFQKGGPEYHCILPPEKDRNNRIFVAMGRNDQGKSTLLQMIALCLHADKEEDIDRPLKRKMLRLIAEDTEKCEVDFTIGTVDAPNLLRATLNNRKIETMINGDRVGPDAIRDQFKILYDVPDEPVRKLQAAIVLVEETFRHYTKYLEDYRNEIEKIKKIYYDFQKRNERLADFASKKEINIKQQLLIDARKNELGLKKAALRKAYVVTSYLRLSKDLDKLEKKVKAFEKRIKELHDQGVGKKSLAFKKQLADFEEHLATFKDTVASFARFSNVVNEPKSRELTKLTAEIESAYSPKQITDEKIRKWHAFFEELQQTLSTNPLIQAEPIELEQIQLFERLLSVLKQFISLEVDIPATDGKNVGEFVKALESAKMSIEAKTGDVRTIFQALEACNAVLARLSEFAVVRSVLPDKDYKDEDEYELVTKDLHVLKNEVQRTENERLKLDEEFAQIPDDEIRTHMTSSRDVEQEYADALQELQGLDEESKELAVRFATLERYEKDLEGVEAPADVDIRECERLSRIVEDIKWKIPLWEKALQAIDITNLDEEVSMDDSRKEFYEALGTYFADKLGVVYFEGQPWEVKQVDLINHAYVVEGRNPINFDDIGTGHTALNSLLTRLETDFGERKKIVLFDEISIMDEQNVATLIRKIKQHVRSGDVLFALLTQVDNDLDSMGLKAIADE